jgi:sulfatase maturation enzyme AslB (radical SAM superfamily)
MHIDNDSRPKLNQPDKSCDFTGIKAITIYLGDFCNFDCVYCDRAYIRDEIGSQNLLKRDHDQIIEFMTLAREHAKELRAISFHGGEPFLYIKRIDQLMERLKPIYGDDVEYYITTNGSLIADNEWFFQKWNGIHITLSYDFNYQEINREPVDLKALSEVLYRNNCYLMFQFVVPTDGFNEDTIAEVIRSAKLARCDTINIIPLRHHRGGQKFKVLIDDIDLKWYSVNLMRFIHALYVLGMKVNIDGNYDKIDKQYLNNHGKLILSPDGYLYPEFDYLEYKRKEFRVGKWKGEIYLDRVKSEEDFIRPGCQTCVARDLCGLKYLYHMFDEEPKGDCVEFYKIISLMVSHLHKLKQQPTLLHWIGHE